MLVCGVVLLCAVVFGFDSFCFFANGIDVAEGGHWVRPILTIHMDIRVYICMCYI